MSHSGMVSLRALLIAIFSLLLAASTASAQQIRIPLPKRSHPTKVQELNQKGVKAVRDNHIEEAKKLFYEAYLIDPDDPFTLNNLGYIAELEGDVDRASRFYDLAAENTSEAEVYRSSEDDLKGKTVAAVAGRTPEGPMRVNRLNVEAIRLLRDDRVSEAEQVLKQALQLDPENPFTLNNLGFTMENEGDLQSAVHYYSNAASRGSDEKVVVALDKDWRGKKISRVAEDNAKRVLEAMQKGESVEAQVARLNLQGVSALNHNLRSKARELFQKAYKLDPNNAFALNNMGYIAELDGDKESANFYYEKAREGDRAGAKVGLATRRDVEGEKLNEVADENNALVSARMQADLRRKRSTEGTSKPVLRTRDNQVVPTPNPSERPEENPPQQEQRPQLKTRPQTEPPSDQPR
jgi:Flp pilus assembly protein TadD